ncbi:hypothetical protein LT493_11700 [Streptomyces tricolor]|nr:hypothetical protein [Streptomyces tricolor]
MLDRLARFIDAVRASPEAEFVAFSDLVAARRITPVFSEGWFATALAEAAGPNIGTTSRLVSPAQLLHALCRGIQGEDIDRAGPGGEVLGPVERPRSAEQPGHPVRLDDKQLREVADSVCRTVAATGALPALARTDGIAVPAATPCTPHCSISSHGTLLRGCAPCRARCRSRHEPNSRRSRTRSVNTTTEGCGAGCTDRTWT